MKKSFLYIFIFLLAVTAFIACQKELSFETPGPATATFAIDTATGECLINSQDSAVVAGKALTDSNVLEVVINVTTPGSYTIETDVVNGYSFKGTGVFTNTGSNLVVLKGTGTPLVTGIDEFKVTYGSSVCTVQVFVAPAGTSGTAVFTIGTTPGTCPAITPSGTYAAGTALNGTNEIEFPIKVTTAGVYTLSTDTVNGIYFAGGDMLTDTGVQTVTLTGFGTPLVADTFQFRLRSGSTICTFSVIVTGTTVPPPAGNCGDSVLGNYIAGTALNSSNKVRIKHTYLTAGTFTVTTNMVNGYSFSDTVVTITPGTIAQIELSGTGTPAAAGTNAFTVNFGDNTTCTFNVTVIATAPPPVTTNTYFPLTTNSFWRYNDVVESDTLRRDVVDSVIRAGNSYKLFVQTNSITDTTHFFFRRAGNDYNEYAYVDNYSLIYFEEEIYGDILFLKEGLTTSQTWTSAEWTGTDTTDGISKKLRYVFTCIDANGTATIGTNSFTNVYKISFKSQTAPAGSSTWTDEGLTWDAWYAKGIGTITLRANLPGLPFPAYQLDIKSWQVQ